MSKERQREIAGKGGRTAHATGRAHRFTSELAKSAGQKGGLAVAARPGYMPALGKKGGDVVSKNIEHMAAIGKKGGYATQAKRAAQRSST